MKSLKSKIKNLIMYKNLHHREDSNDIAIT